MPTGLVEQQQNGASHQGPADRQHLLLAARERARLLSRYLAGRSEKRKYSPQLGSHLGNPGKSKGVFTMTDKIRDCVKDIVAIADGPRPRVFDLARQHIERVFADAEQGEYFSVAQTVRYQLGQALNGHRGGAAQFLEDLIEWLDEHHLGR
jgi:hypothetical protein